MEFSHRTARRSAQSPPVPDGPLYKVCAQFSINAQFCINAQYKCADELWTLN